VDLKLHKAGETKPGTVQVSDAIFATRYNEPLIHQVVTACMAGVRSGTKAQKSRSDVSGGGRKPWRQKGLGRARAGTTRGPLWRGGGVTFAARPRDYQQKVNKKMYSAAMRSVLSELIRQDRLVVVNELTLEAPKTKLLVNKLKEFGLDNVLILNEAFDEKVFMAARNLPNVGICDVASMDPVVLIRFEKVLITVPALKLIEERLS